MKTLPFIIEKFVLRDRRSQTGELVELTDDFEAFPNNSDTAIPGYFVMSSATPNIDGDNDSATVAGKGPQAAQQQNLETAAQGIKEIANYLYQVYTNTRDSPELVVTVHGYNTSRSSVQSWYKDIFYYINRYDAAIASQRTQVFIGYRWPSESVRVGRLFESLIALPPLPRDLLIAGGLATLGLVVIGLLEFFLWKKLVAALLLTVPLFLLTLLGLMMVTLVVMRLVVYFRDRYRASNFGVLDLVELLRQIDWALVQLKANDIADDIKMQSPSCPEAEANSKALDQATKEWRQEKRRVKLSFIGHSMGGFVVTSAVRILSDVFDARSIEQHPPADVGSVFRLERLLLASPDIPILTLISNRANFLASSLRRFAESYLLSSEGDIALRMASTTANYIAFPSRTQHQGYRLGNVALQDGDCGIVNLNALNNDFIEGKPLQEIIAGSSQKILSNLFVTAERSGVNQYVTLDKLFRKQPGQESKQVTVADFFTFFDCTDYKDVEFSVRDLRRTRQSGLGGLFAWAREKKPLGLFDYIWLTVDYATRRLDAPKGILTSAQRKKMLSPFDYFGLAVDYATGRRDVHGGYFRGEFTQRLIYRTAFLGFTGYLKTLDDDTQNAFDPSGALSKFDAACREKGIQGFLSPIRYRVDIQKHKLSETIQELLVAIAPPLEKKVEEKVKDE